ncbi:MAG: nucleoside-diphosphate kinase [Minisyncoccia bacterium]
MTHAKHYKNEQTFIILKPDAIQRSLVGEIIGRLERVGLKMVALKMVIPEADLVAKHYTIDPEWKRKAGEKAISKYVSKGMTPPEADPVKVGNTVLENLKNYMSSGPVVAMIWQGAHAVPLVRKLVGATEPLSSDVGTIRGDFVLDSYEMSDADGRSIRNIIHASGNVEEARQEIALWFKPEDVLDYRHIQEEIIYSLTFKGKDNN